MCIDLICRFNLRTEKKEPRFSTGDAPKLVDLTKLTRKRTQRNNLISNDESTLGFGGFTTKGEAIGGDDAGLDDGVLLSRKGLLQQAHALDCFRPEADEEEAEKAGGDVERGDDAGGEIQLHYDDAEQDGEDEPHHEGAHRQLLPPRRHGLVRERLLHRGHHHLLGIAAPAGVASPQQAGA